MSTIISSLTAKSQTINDLDTNPTFKGITIGEPISKHSNILSYKGTRNGINAYNVTNRNYLSIFNIKMDEMVILEKNGRVYAILLNKIQEKIDGCTVFNADNLLVLLSNLISKYGKPNVDLDKKQETLDSPMVSGVRWEGHKIVLDIYYLFYGTIDSKNPELNYMLYERHDDY